MTCVVIAFISILVQNTLFFYVSYRTAPYILRGALRARVCLVRGESTWDGVPFADGLCALWKQPLGPKPRPDMRPVHRPPSRPLRRHETLRCDKKSRFAAVAWTERTAPAREAGQPPPKRTARVDANCGKPTFCSSAGLRPLQKGANRWQCAMRRRTGGVVGHCLLGSALSPLKVGGPT
jgi:hypothetical protein